MWNTRNTVKLCWLLWCRLCLCELCWQINALIVCSTNQWILSSLTFGIFESTLLQFYLTSESSGRTNKLWLDDSRVNCWACVFAIFFSTILISIKASSSLDFGVESTDSQRRHWESKFSSCHAGRPRVHPDYKAQKFPDRPK